MAAENKLLKVFTAFKGLDLRSSDILRTDDAATELKNMQFRQTGAMNKRKGHQTLDQSGTGGGYGVATFENVDTTTGIITKELVGVDDNLAKLSSYTFTITYGGSNAGVYYKTYFSSGNFYFDIYDNYTRVLNKNCGTGFETSGRVTIADLTTAINALTDFTCGSGTGATTNSAAFIPLMSSSATVEISGGGTAVTYHAWEDIATPQNFDNPVTTGQTTPFYNFYAQRTSASFENATFAQLRDVLYIATGHDELMKYDGNRVYRAGLPKGYITSLTQDTGGTPAAVANGSSTQYMIRYEYTDAKENIITGTLSDTSTYANSSGGTADVDIVVQNMQDGSAGITSEIGARGFNTDQATVNGTQAGVTTITVDAGHALQVGDYVYIADGVSGTTVSRKVTASASTTITISGDAVNVSDNDIISCIKIQVYRTEDYTAAPGLFYLVTELVNDRDNATQSYNDATASSALSANAQLIVPVKTRDEPPRCKYIDTWRTNLIMGGNKTAVTTVYYSDIDSPEYFPDGDNSFLVTNKVTGIKSLDDSLFVFKERSIDVVAGDFNADNFQVDQISKEGIGCVAHSSIQQVQGSLFFLSSQGVYAVSSQGVQDVGAQISPKFQINNPFSFTQAVGFNWQENKQYVLFMPALATAGSAAISNDSQDEIYVYDYFRGAWLVWENQNMMGGITELDSEIYFCKRLDSNIGLNKVLRTGSAADYNDHGAAVAFVFKSNWMTLSEPTVWKKFLRCKLHSYDTSINDFESDTFTLTLKTEHDYNNVKTWTNITYDFSGGASGWGLGAWGSFPWGDIRLSQLKKKLASKKVRSMRIILENSTRGENVLISGYELELVTPYKPMMKE